jgi:hypothetical protein
MALLENCPVIKPYDENAWAFMDDSIHFPICSSYKILEGIHERWAYLLRNLAPKEKNRVFFHPEKKRKITITETVFLYAWHGRHHLAHISNLKSRISQSLS